MTKGEYQNRKVWARGMEVSVGVDVHKESWHVTARMEGEEVFHGGIPSQYDALWGRIHLITVRHMT